MNTFKYRIYYEYLGPTKSDPSAQRLTSDQVQHQYESLPASLRHCLADIDPQILTEDAPAAISGVLVTLITNSSEDDVDNSVSRCLKKLNSSIPDLSLFVDKLKI